MKFQKKYTHKKAISLSSYCSEYVQKFNAIALQNNWKRKAALVAATATVTTSMWLGTFNQAQAQAPFACSPEFAPAGIISVPEVRNDLADQYYYSKPAFVDIDNDGDFDLFVGESGSKAATNMVFYRNTGTNANPVYAAAAFNPFGINVSTQTYVAPSFVDIDNDGDQDMFIGTETNGVIFYRNVGTPTVANFAGAPTTNPFGMGVPVGGYHTPTFADINGDGKKDMLLGNSLGNVLFYNNTGTAAVAAFAAPVTNPFGLTSVGTFVAPRFVDLNADGKLDLMVGELSGDFNYFRNTGTTTVPTFTAVAVNPFEITPLVGLGFGESSPVFADIDNDGDQDMFSGVNKKQATNAPLVSYKNIGTAAQADFLASPYDLPLVGTYAAPAFADVDGDGDLDAFVGNGVGQVRYAVNTAGAGNTPSYAASTVLFTIPTGTEANPTLADIDGDGDYDMMVGSSTGNYFYYINNGTATVPNFVLQGTNPFNLTNAGTYSAPQFVDFDNDGDMDIFSGRGGAAVWYFQNTGTAQAPNYATPQEDPFGITNVPGFHKVTLADLDGDGDKDMLIGGGTVINFYANTGTVANPQFAAPVNNPFALTITGTYFNPEFVDINGDGNFELFVGENNLGLTRAYSNSKLLPTITLAPTGTFSACGTGLIRATIGNYSPSQVTVTWYNAITNIAVATGLDFNPEVLGNRASYYVTVVTTDGCRAVSSIRNYVPVVPPSTFDLTGEAGYNSVTLNWERNGQCNAPVREYEVYADPGGFGSYFLLGFSSTPSYEAVGLINGEKITFQIRPIYMNGTYGIYSNTVTLKPSIVLGEEDNAKDGFAFYPNPNNGEFNLRLQDGSASATVSVTSLSGQRVYTTTLNATQTSINLGNIASGMYIVRVETAQGTYQQKVSVVR